MEAQEAIGEGKGKEEREMQTRQGEGAAWEGREEDEK